MKLSDLTLSDAQRRNKLCKGHCGSPRPCKDCSMYTMVIEGIENAAIANAVVELHENGLLDVVHSCKNDDFVPFPEDCYACKNEALLSEARKEMGR